MLKKHRNAIFETLQQCGSDPARFKVQDDNPGGFPSEVTLTLKDIPFWVKISHRKDSGNQEIFIVTFTAYDDYLSGIYQAGGNYRNIGDVLQGLKYWTQSIAKYESDLLKEKQTPDLWAQLGASSPLISDSPISSDDTSEFTEEEKKALHGGVRSYRLLVMAEFKPNEEQAKAINDRLDYLEKAIDKLNRFDWKALALSTVISIGVNLTVDTEMGKRLFQLFAQAFNAAIKLLPGL